MKKLLFSLQLLISSLAYPQCPFTASPDSAVCAGTQVQLFATAGFNFYHWSPGTGLSDSTIANPVATVVDDVSYTVTAMQTTGSAGSNLIYNGDFSLGNTGFTSGLNYSGIYNPGRYYVGNTYFNTSFSQGDVTATTDEMLMSVDGSASLLTLWEQTIPAITPATGYTFGFWCTDTGVNPPQFEIHFIGNITGDNIIATLPGIMGPFSTVPTWTWSQYSLPVWNSGANTSVTIRIVNTELNGYGNDFALDDFIFQTGSSVICVGTDTVNLTVNPQPAPPVVQDTSYCPGAATVQVQATGSNITWYATAGSSTGTAIAPIPASINPGQFTYFATQTVSGCESDTAALTVEILDRPPLFALDPSTPPCPARTKMLGPTDNTWQYLWMDGLTVSPRLLAESGNYVLTASNFCGSHTDSVSFIIEDCSCYFYLPNAFTPNHNGINDEFKPVYDCMFSTYRMTIFNRWGEKIFETADPQKGWDATYRGTLSEQGVYVVHIDYTALDQSGYVNPKSVTGSVTVVR